MTKNDKTIRGTRTSGYRRALVTGLVLVAVFLLPREGRVRTWHVKADSTGEVPTIRAALDSAVTGDTILVGPGTYVVRACNYVEKGIILTSEAGPTETRIVPGSPPEYMPLCAFYIRQVTTGRTEISGFWFDGSYYDGTGDGGVIGIDRCDSVYVINNVFTNYRATGIAFTVGYSYWFFIENNTFVGGRYAINNHGSLGWARYNIMWSRLWGVSGIWGFTCNCILELDDAGYFKPFNFEANPQFCGTVDSRNLFLQTDSPCAPGNIPPIQYQCDTLRVIGALPVGCGTTPVKTTSWGAIKNIYK